MSIVHIDWINSIRFFHKFTSVKRTGKEKKTRCSEHCQFKHYVRGASQLSAFNATITYSNVFTFVHLWNVTASTISMHRHIFLSHLTGSHAACITFLQLPVVRSFILSSSHYFTFSLLFFIIYDSIQVMRTRAHTGKKKQLEKEMKWTHAQMWQIAHLSPCIREWMNQWKLRYTLNQTRSDVIKKNEQRNKFEVSAMGDVHA